MSQTKLNIDTNDILDGNPSADPTQQVDLPKEAAGQASLDQVDKELADLEAMLAETVAESDAEPARDRGAAEKAPTAPAAQPVKATSSAAGGTPDHHAEQRGQAAETGASEANAHPSATAKGQDTESVKEVRPETPAPDHEARPAEPAPQQGAATPQEPPITAGQAARRVINRIPSTAVAILDFVDLPFARLGPRTKTMLGCIGIATLLVAVATWILGCFWSPA